MSLFITVESVEKGCEVIINLDHVTEIAPLVEGGCNIFYGDSHGLRSIRVRDDYTQFKQFALQTVSPEMIAKKIESLKVAAAPQEEEKRGRGRPKGTGVKYDLGDDTAAE